MVKHMDSDALRDMVIVGASIGAVNGFLIASRMQGSRFRRQRAGAFLA